MSDDLREKMLKDMKGSGHMSLSTFIRMVLYRYPNSDKKWTDADMKAFAREYSEREQPRMGVLQSADIQLNEAFMKFQNKKV